MKKEPKNYPYWRTILDNKEQVEEFMLRGNARQKKELKKAFIYFESQKNQKQQDLFNT